jgi:hypothetical protein
MRFAADLLDISPEMTSLKRGFEVATERRENKETHGSFIVVQHRRR